MISTSGASRLASASMRSRAPSSNPGGDAVATVRTFTVPVPNTIGSAA
jgi:hypothetical protein